MVWIATRLSAWQTGAGGRIASFAGAVAMAIPGLTIARLCPLPIRIRRSLFAVCRSGSGPGAGATDRAGACIRRILIEGRTQLAVVNAAGARIRADRGMRIKITACREEHLPGLELLWCQCLPDDPLWETSAAAASARR